MPHDLFGDVVVRPPSTSSRRSSVVVFSVVAHAAAIVALVIVPLFATDTLPPPQGPIHWHSGIRVPQKIVDVAPIYPRFARDAHAQGIVIIEATIDARGNVVAARVTKSVSLLDQAALDAVRQWKFSPTLLNGVPVPIIMTVTVRFILQ